MLSVERGRVRFPCDIYIMIIKTTIKIRISNECFLYTLQESFDLQLYSLLILLICLYEAVFEILVILLPVSRILLDIQE